MEKAATLESTTEIDSFLTELAPALIQSGDQMNTHTSSNALCQSYFQKDYTEVLLSVVHMEQPAAKMKLMNVTFHVSQTVERASNSSN